MLYDGGMARASTVSRSLSDKTRVPVKLLDHEGGLLISRSQSKRLTARFERFKEVILDFKGVESIGQAFADELFRVFLNQHPEVHFMPINMSTEVASMIARVTHTKKEAYLSDPSTG